jgi:hypothetical protein
LTLKGFQVFLFSRSPETFKPVRDQGGRAHSSNLWDYRRGTERGGADLGNRSRHWS